MYETILNFEAFIFVLSYYSNNVTITSKYKYYFIFILLHRDKLDPIDPIIIKPTSMSIAAVAGMFIP